MEDLKNRRKMQSAKCKMKNPKRRTASVSAEPTFAPFLDFTFCILHFAFFFSLLPLA
jgi:hypothetical protein